MLESGIAAAPGGAAVLDRPERPCEVEGSPIAMARALRDATFGSLQFSSITTDTRGLIQIFNIGAEHLLGYDAAEVIDRMTPADLSDPVDLFARARLVGDELDLVVGAGFEALVCKAVRGEQDHFEWTFLRRDGTRQAVFIHVTALRDPQGVVIGHLLICNDDTVRRQAQQSRQQAGALQRAIFDSAMFSKIATDARGVIQIFNVGAERMLGYAASDVTNRITPADISDPQELILRAKALSSELGTTITPGFEALVFKASRGIEDIYELTYVRKNGSRFPAVVSVTALRDVRDAIIGYLLIGTDNTERKLAEQAQRAMYAELSRAKQVAEKASLAKSDFLSSMSHELRSPLNAILGFAQLIESGAPPPTDSQKESVEQILQAGWYLLELINEILDLSLIESGKLSLSPEPMSVSELLDDCRAMIEPQAHKGGIRMSFPDLGDPFVVKADRTRVKQVLINLLSNAIKYNRPGGTVEVSCARHGPLRTRVSFRDTGAGLSDAEVAQLFEPFNRLGQESGAEEGTGIGLVVSKRLVELMGGAIGVRSTPGVGSVFWIELVSAVPLELAAPQGEAPVSTQRPRSADEVRYTVLCVEDNPANLLLIQKLVARRPEVVLLSARDGPTGIEMARSCHPDVILMDINLPGISGLLAQRILREDPATAAIPVVALSANAMPHDIARGLEAGFFRYLTKPIQVAEFMDTLDAALARSGAASRQRGEGSDPC